MRPSSSIKRMDIEKGAVGSLRHLFRYIGQYKLLIFGACIALVFSSSAVLGIGRGLEFLVDEGFGPDRNEVLDKAFIGLLIIAVVLSVATFARFYLVTQIGEKLVADIRRDVYRHLMHLSPAFYDKTSTGEIMSRMTADTTFLQFVIGSSLSIALRNILMLIGGVAMLIATSTKLAIYIAIAVPAVVLPILFLGKKVRRLSSDAQQKVADISTCAQETTGAIRTVQAYARENYEYNRFSDLVRVSYLSAMKRVRVRAWLTAMVIMLAFGSVIFVLWTGGHDVLSGEMSFGELSAFLFYSLLVAGSFGALSEVAGDLQRAGGAAERLIELLHTKSEIEIADNMGELPDDVRGNLVFEGITFAYPARPKTNVLSDISFSIQSGETVALVGPSGAGKSTIFQLLLRFYDAQQGRILLDGVATNIVDPKILRGQFALVSQDPVIFSGTARSNIAYGNVSATEGEIIEAAKVARAYDFIMELPQGFDTFLGERGVLLSGGQRQRISIARAILKNPRVLLLDEATNALDAENEKLVQEALDKLMENRTTLVIAHRLATIIGSDRIIVFNEGKIEAMDTHEELVRQGALYSRLADMQFGTG